MKRYFICNRHAQCGSPCHDKCMVTSDFFKSKAYQSKIKSDIVFIKDTHGDWVQMSESIDKYLDDSQIKKPLEYIKIPYDFLLQFELKRRLKRETKKS